MARKGNVKGAIEMYNKALELAKSELTSSHPNEEALLFDCRLSRGNWRAGSHSGR
jgi:hypothetical protein